MEAQRRDALFAAFRREAPGIGGRGGGPRIVGGFDGQGGSP